MERFICIHGHFYQPPRENAWLEAVESQDSAYPYHDWNERITAECYGPNAYARILDDQARIIRLVNNYAKISFNFGPTLLSWLQVQTPEVYRAILQADKDSLGNFAGHGSALAQAYSHMIMPLSTKRDKVTQVLWGLRDFESRFARKPEGMWLPETAVDLETLDILAEQGLKFTILSPYQSKAVRPLEGQDWEDVAGGRIDPSRAYLQKLPSGRSITLFFYDGPISQAVAFERILSKGDNFVGRLRSGFHDERGWSQLVHIATDGESYGHHHTHGDMALASALRQIEVDADIKLTNYGAFLEKNPPTHEVQIFENSSWSCAHGIERWRGNCGCNSGRQGWNQNWRGPLRQALDWLRDTLAEPFETLTKQLLKDPWGARNDYIRVILDRSPDNIRTFLRDHAVRDLGADEQARACKLLEMQRHLLLMYTSCGWFFDEISGIETVQIIQYAGRALQLAQELFNRPLESEFLEKLSLAKSNIAEHKDGKVIYEKLVKPVMIDWGRIAAHYAVTTLFEVYPEQARIYCYTADREDFHAFDAGKTKLVVGKARITSDTTLESALLTFGVLHFGDHNVHGGVRPFQDDQSYLALVEQLKSAFEKADFAEIIRLMDRGFGDHTYSLQSLFRDEQRKFTKLVLQPTVSEAESAYRRLFEQHLPTMRYLSNIGAPVPRVFQATAEFLVNLDLRWAFKDDEPNLEHIRSLFAEAVQWKVQLDKAGLAYEFKLTLGRLADRFRQQPTNLVLGQTLESAVDLSKTMPFEVDLWETQNFFFDAQRQVFPAYLKKAQEGGEEARAWVDSFLRLGDKLGVQVEELKKK